ncbi:Ff.00g063090.m01.CDS01 [Fusarium sp. VM40]|nr:hypothetical protein FAVG1_11358 [Fusarium avenaceum]CAJ0552330.1 Ff.00g063090.m01.CDS01 [Fusarium sp. VM40]
MAYDYIGIKAESMPLSIQSSDICLKNYKEASTFRINPSQLIHSITFSSHTTPSTTTTTLSNMQFKLLPLLALAGLTTATGSWLGMENLPDGPYKGVNHDDGSTTVTNLKTGESFEFGLSNESAANEKRTVAIEKRETSCWGYELDHGGVDSAVVQLKNWAGSGQDLVSREKPTYFGYNARGVYVYYCINAPWSGGNIDVNDINYALEQMDGQCKRYEAGFYRWDGSAELVGKVRSGTAVCLG